ncbi:MAG: ABC transporter permease [Paracoccaceae bacterium]
MRKARKDRNVLLYPGFGLFTVAFFAYLYLPIAVVVFYSFNANRIVSVWTGFSLEWYGKALANRSLMAAVSTSLTVAITATVIATVVALMAALVLTRPKGLRFARLSETIVNLPLLLPEIALAVASLIVFSQIGLADGMIRLVISHTVFCIPFAYLPIRARLLTLDPDLDEASADLYASRWVTFRRVTLPLILPGIFAGATLAFVISMDDFITSNMVSSGGTTTLPVYIFGLVRKGTTPELNALSSIIILVSLAIALLVLFVAALRRRADPPPITPKPAG